MKAEANAPTSVIEHPCPGTAHKTDAVEAQPVWCRPCQALIMAAIKNLPSQCGELLPGPLNTGRDVDLETHTDAVNPPSLSPGWDTADEVIRWAVRVEDQLRAHLGHADRTGELWRSLGASVAYLTSWETALLCCPDAEAVGVHALALAARLERVTGGDEPTVRLPDMCAHCSCRGLEHVDGAKDVRCRYCGGTWSWDSYQAIKAYGEKVGAA